MIDQTAQMHAALQLTRRMRVEQKKFFAASVGSAEKRHALTASKTLERQVDEALRQLSPDEPAEQRLFR